MEINYQIINHDRLRKGSKTVVLIVWDYKKYCAACVQLMNVRNDINQEKRIDAADLKE